LLPRKSQALLLLVLRLSTGVSFVASASTDTGTAAPTVVASTFWVRTTHAYVVGTTVVHALEFDAPDDGMHRLFATFHAGGGGLCQADGHGTADALACLCGLEAGKVPASSALDKSPCTRQGGAPSLAELLGMVRQPFRQGGAADTPWCTPQERAELAQGGVPAGFGGLCFGAPARVPAAGGRTKWAVNVYYSLNILRSEGTVLSETADRLEIDAGVALHALRASDHGGGAPRGAVESAAASLLVTLRLSAGVVSEVTAEDASFVGGDVAGVLSAVYAPDGGSTTTLKAAYTLTPTNGTGVYTLDGLRTWRHGDTEARLSCSQAAIDEHLSSANTDEQCSPPAAKLCELLVSPPSYPGGHAIGAVTVPLGDTCPVRGHQGALHLAAQVCLRRESGVVACRPTETIFQNPGTTDWCDPYNVRWDVRNFFSFFTFQGMVPSKAALLSAVDGWGKDIMRVAKEALTSLPIFTFVLRGADALLDPLRLIHVKAAYCIGASCPELLESVRAVNLPSGYALRGDRGLCPTVGTGNGTGILCYSDDMLVGGVGAPGRFARYTQSAVDGKGAGPLVTDTFITCNGDDDAIRQFADDAAPLIEEALTEMHPTSPGGELGQGHKRAAFVACAYASRLDPKPGDRVHVKFFFYVLLDVLRRMAGASEDSATTYTRDFSYVVPPQTTNTSVFKKHTGTVQAPATRYEVCTFTESEREAHLRQELNPVLRGVVKGQVEFPEGVDTTLGAGETPCGDSDDRRSNADTSAATSMDAVWQAEISEDFDLDAAAAAFKSRGITFTYGEPEPQESGWGFTEFMYLAVAVMLLIIVTLAAPRALACLRTSKDGTTDTHRTGPGWDKALHSNLAPGTVVPVPLPGKQTHREIPSQMLPPGIYDYPVHPALRPPR